MTVVGRWLPGPRPTIRFPVDVAVAVAVVIASGCSASTDRGALPDGEARDVSAGEEPTPTTTPELEYDLQGHRGARGLRPENTLPAFELALDELVDTLELDLHLTADDVVVVWHDPELGAEKCDVDGGSLRIRESTLADIDEIRCDRNPDRARFPAQVATAGTVTGDDYTLATLADVYALVGDYAASPEKSEAQRANAAQVRLNVETKRKPSDPGAIGDGFDGSTMGRFEEQLLATAEEAGMLDRTTVQSFDHRSLSAIHTSRPEVVLAALTTLDDTPDFSELVALGATIWSPDHRSLTVENIAEAQTAGLLVVPWTVNEPERMTELLTSGVDGLITDRPDIAPRP